MDIRPSKLNDVPVFEVRGEIDHSSSASLESALDQAISAGSTAVLIDLRQVDYIDSGGLSVLLSGVRVLRERGWLGVIGPNTNVKRLLEIVGLLVDPGFRLFGTVEEAGQATSTERMPA